MGAEESIFDYGGAGQIAIGTLRLIEPEGTPQREQVESFPGVDGSFVLYHGKSPRVLLFDGVLDFTNQVGAYAAMLTNLDAIQARINIVGTLYHPFGDTVKQYTYCQLNDYRRVGNVGFNTGLMIMKVRAKFTQLVW